LELASRLDAFSGYHIRT